MALAAGEQIGHYKIHSLIGKGGMGEVFRALDTKLEREVAIKILPAALASDPERLARFGREAKVLAQLNHPGIASITVCRFIPKRTECLCRLCTNRSESGSVAFSEADPCSLETVANP